MGFVPGDLSTLMRTIVRFDQRNSLFLLPADRAILPAQTMQFPYREAFGNIFDCRDWKNDPDHAFINARRPKSSKLSRFSGIGAPVSLLDQLL